MDAKSAGEADEKKKFTIGGAGGNAGRTNLNGPDSRKSGCC